MDLALVVVVVAIALVFAYTNGFQDAANAIATSVSTRALAPLAAVLLAAVMNFVGALLGTGVAEVVGSGIIDPPAGTSGLRTVLAGLLGAICWNLMTWWRGLPSSSSHALIGGLAGAGIASMATVHWATIIGLVLIPAVVVPLVGFVVAHLATIATLWLCRHATPGPTMHRFRIAQTVSAAATALGHGLQDAQKTMGVIVLALTVGGLHSGPNVPWWVILCAAAAISAGTYAGGWRIIRTLGRRLVRIDPARGFVAESVAATALYTTALLLQAPVSTTHTITAAILGAGTTGRRSAVRWGVARDVAVAWLLTLPAAGALAAAAHLVLAVVL